MRSLLQSYTLVALLGTFGISAASAETITRFTVVESSPTSWVARGLNNYTVTPADGWTFTPSRNFDNGVGFQITGQPLPSAPAIDRWFLNFAAPFNAELAPGVYADFQRFPFQDADRPGLEFGSTGRLDNQAAGTFEVLEATYGPGGEVLSFAADFIHFGETDPDRYAIVEIRYNIEVVTEVEVAIDVNPKNHQNMVNLRSKRDLSVAVLSTDTFDALTVADETVLFGDPTLIDMGDGEPVAPIGSSVEDVNRDGLDDVVLLFDVTQIADAGALDGASTIGMLTGETTDGTPIFGSDDVLVKAPK